MSDEHRLSAQYLLSRLPSDTSTATGANSAKEEIAIYLEKRDERVKSESVRTPPPPEAGAVEEALGLDPIGDWPKSELTALRAEVTRLTKQSNAHRDAQIKAEVEVKRLMALIREVNI